jgi:hypothetical protein
MPDDGWLLINQSHRLMLEARGQLDHIRSELSETRRAIDSSRKSIAECMAILEQVADRHSVIGVN